MERPKLYESRKDLFFTFGLLTLLLLFHLLYEYRNYQNFISLPFYYTYADVETARIKENHRRRYQVLKLKSQDGKTFYTTTHEKKLLNGYRLRLQIFPEKSISFWDYLGTFYVKSRIKAKEKQPLGSKEYLTEKIASQHGDRMMQAFYNAIFFATPIPHELREKITLLGVSHLVALSGFHLGILWALVYGVLLLLYKPLQQRYFPYRFALIDVGAVSILLLGAYVLFVGAPPSLVRAYAMVLLGWLLLILGVELLSFPFLFTVAALLFVLYPLLIVSLSFWFSFFGVFYIFLLLQYTGHWNKWVITLLVIPVGIFLLMLPVVHTFFPLTSHWQILSVLLSLLFIPFYPLAILLHICGCGDWFDTALGYLFSLPESGSEVWMSWWMFGIYTVLSIGAIWRRSLFLLLFATAVVYAVYLFGAH